MKSLNLKQETVGEMCIKKSLSLSLPSHLETRRKRFYCHWVIICEKEGNEEPEALHSVISYRATIRFPSGSSSSSLLLFFVVGS